ncbi:MAG: hypothetical protein KAX69_03635 [Chitinophagales bacterium]|nr:hypothetical protein [Chitinophagales bacterium]
MKITFRFLIFISLAICSCERNNNNARRTSISYEIVFTEYVNDSTSQIVKINDDATNKTIILKNDKDPVNTGEIFNNTFLFSERKRNGDSTFLYSFDLTNNTSTLITKGAYSLYISTMSPNRTKIAFDKNFKLGIINFNGSNNISLPYNLPADAIGDGAFKFTKDNSIIIFQKDGDILSSINTDGTNLVTLSEGLIFDYISGGFSVSPDNKIIYVNSDNPNQIKSISYNGQNESLIYSDPNLSELLNPVISNDGSKIVFVKYETTGIINLCMINIDGSGFRKLTNNTSSVSNMIYSGIEWSPDDNKILFVEFNESVQNYLRIKVYNAIDDSFKIISENAINIGHWVK